MTRQARLAAAVLAAAALAACRPPRPAAPSAAALYRDLERIVTVAETAGWGVDRLELEEQLAPALDSVCRVERTTREQALAWVRDELARRGGPVEAAWQARGRRLSAVGSLLTLSRVERLMAHALDRADADCPFWLEPAPRFAGRQISDDRWHLTGGGGGKAIVVSQDGRTDLSFGGAGRILVGRSVGATGVYVGGELGASGSFPKTETGERGQLVFGFDLVAPVVVRRSFVNGYLEVEAGWLGHVEEDAPEQVDHGVHVGVALGARATRTRFFFPGAVFGVSVDRTFPDDGAALTMLKAGFRVALDLDL